MTRRGSNLPEMRGRRVGAVLYTAHCLKIQFVDPALCARLNLIHALLDFIWKFLNYTRMFSIAVAKSISIISCTVSLYT